MRIPQLVTDLVDRKVLSACNFIVTLGVAVPFAFQSISGLELKKAEYRYINEGGRNHYPIKLKQPVSTPHKLTFTRGVPMYDAIGAIAISTILEKVVFSKNLPGFIFVLDNAREVEILYEFVAEDIVEHTLSDLNAMNPEIFIESLTIIHHGLRRIPVPPTML